MWIINLYNPNVIRWMTLRSRAPSVEVASSSQQAFSQQAVLRQFSKSTEEAQTHRDFEQVDVDPFKVITLCKTDGQLISTLSLTVFYRSST